MNAAEAKLQTTSDERQKILVIDDDAVIRQFMERIISDAGHEVRTVRDGLSALDVLNSYRPHMVFLDIILPETDLEGARIACERLRQMVEKAGYSGKSALFGLPSALASRRAKPVPRIPSASQSITRIRPCIGLRKRGVTGWKYKMARELPSFHL